MKDANFMEELKSLLFDAQKASMELKHFSEDNLHIFSGDDDEQLNKVLDHRERLIGLLIALDKEIHAMSAEHEIASLPEYQETRQSIRSALDAVMEMDRKATKLLESKMLELKNKTVSVRNKKHISAYIKSSTAEIADNKFDYIK